MPYVIEEVDAFETENSSCVGCCDDWTPAVGKREDLVRRVLCHACEDPSYRGTTGWNARDLSDNKYVKAAVESHNLHLWSVETRIDLTDLMVHEFFLDILTSPTYQTVYLVETKTFQGSDVYVFGDIHGNYTALRMWLDHTFFPSITAEEETSFKKKLGQMLHMLTKDQERQWPSIERPSSSSPTNAAKLIFLGDYVDRGPESVPVVLCLILLRKLFKDDVVLLRGNHEFVDTNYVHGFKQECYDRAPHDHGVNVYILCNAVFETFPIALDMTIQSDPITRYFCVHGGIAPSFKDPTIPLRDDADSHMNMHQYTYGKDKDRKEAVHSVFDLKTWITQKEAPVHVYEQEGRHDPVVTQMVWNDPYRDDEKSTYDWLPNEARHANSEGPIFCLMFTPRITQFFCEFYRYDKIIRAHEVMKTGIHYDHDERVITVFSSPYYDNKNKARALRFDASGNLTTLRMKRNKWRRSPTLTVAPRPS